LRVARLSVLFVFAWSCCAEATSEQMQAAYLCRFLDFVEWPPTVFDSSRTLTLCVIGNQTLTRVLEGLAPGVSVSGRSIVIRQVADPKQAKACQVLFLTGRRQTVAKQLADLQLAPILTVSDIPTFGNDGGIITFYLKNGHLLFDINVENAKSRKLSISSQLLQLSSGVQ
jgi:hypothetical protein